ncbi:bifunctional 3-(3-hydroxy-phenyl)propionate/3-hydroxycinnamic acid hydroxylase [Microterricola pindariensis]|uniref:FAD-binding domain-containing protein n=1 Tax=Microterricola pindariensis TaxID=478010 RepID=A0ABX5AVC7_9MICO|nr:bifunctional 3-(3-hydroxy-phenyl)propionate/3-hydroxycinnamic acid hydroxylase [Microterricola pindariensis]PPL17199.1 hypothetical protein GY24_11750 [Microterricola pindariensis]
MECDVVIVGLGPVGAFMANLLHESGLSVVAFDREPGVVQSPRGVGIDGEIMRAVQAIGLTDELNPLLKVFRGAQYLDVDGQVVSTRPGVSGEGSQGWPDRYNVHQPDLESVLRSGIGQRAIDARNSHDVVSVVDEVDCAVVEAVNLTNGERARVRGRFVVGCDGGRSFVRKIVGTQLDDFGLNEPWIVVDFAVKDSAELPEINTHYADPHEPVIYIHVVRDLRRFEFKAAPGEDLEAAVDPENIWRRVSRWLRPEEAELLRAVVYTHRALVAETWTAGHVLLAGDAAHQTPPFLGQGLCTGVRDVISLCWRLRAIILEGASTGLLRSYESERSEHARFFIRTATSLGAVLTDPDRTKLTELNARIGREGSGEPPRLGAGVYSADGPAGGLLAPQPRLADGRRLDDLVGYRFGIVVSPSLAAQMSDDLRGLISSRDWALIEATGPAAEWLEELGSGAAIVRPDRYYYSTAGDVDALSRQLRELESTLFAGLDTVMR